MTADGGSASPDEADEDRVVEMKSRASGEAQDATATAETNSRRSRRRLLIMAIVPALLLAGGAYLWLAGGRYVSTDDAYLKQDKVTVAADVSGRIVEVAVQENEHVAQDQVLFRIDPEPYRLALDGAEAALASARLQVEQLRAAYQQAVAEEGGAAMDLGFRQKAFDRQKGLLDKGVSPQANYDAAENALHNAQQALSQATNRKLAALAALGGDASIATDAHPTVLAALAKRDEARRNLDNTQIQAPAAGVVSQADRLQVGQYVTAAAPMLTVVETDRTWVEANFKETDLTNMAVGQHATVTLDAFPRHRFTGEVASIGAGTGAEFALLPAQNATGNWVKVVQRVPVRIRFTEPTDGVPLRLGLTSRVEVDTESTPGAAGQAGSSAAAAPAKP